MSKYWFVCLGFLFTMKSCFGYPAKEFFFMAPVAQVSTSEQPLQAVVQLTTFDQFHQQVLHASCPAVLIHHEADLTKEEQEKIENLIASLRRQLPSRVAFFKIVGAAQWFEQKYGTAGIAKPLTLFFTQHKMVLPMLSGLRNEEQMMQAIKAAFFNNN